MDFAIKQNSKADVMTYVSALIRQKDQAMRSLERLGNDIGEFVVEHL